MTFQDDELTKFEAEGVAPLQGPEHFNTPMITFLRKVLP